MSFGAEVCCVSTEFFRADLTDFGAGLRRVAAMEVSPEMAAFSFWFLELLRLKMKKHEQPKLLEIGPFPLGDGVVLFVLEDEV